MQSVGSLTTVPQEEIARREAYLASLNAANASNRNIFDSQIRDLAPRRTDDSEENDAIDEAPEDAHREERELDENDCEEIPDDDRGNVVRAQINEIKIKIAALDLKMSNLSKESHRFRARHEEVLAQPNGGNFHITKAAMLDLGEYIGDVVVLQEMEKGLVEKMEEWLQAHTNIDVSGRNGMWPDSELQVLVSQVRDQERKVKNWENTWVSLRQEIRLA